MYRLYFNVPARKNYSSYPYVWYNTSTCECVGVDKLSTDTTLCFTWFNPSYYDDISYIEVRSFSELPTLYPELFI